MAAVKNHCYDGIMSDEVIGWTKRLAKNMKRRLTKMLTKRLTKKMKRRLTKRLL